VLPHLTPTEAEVVARYRRVLPASEYAAVEAWLSTFYPFQRRWLLEPGRFALCNKSRQIGVSHTTSGVGVLWGAVHGELTTIISIGDTESREVLDKARRHASVLRDLGCKMAEVRKSNTTELEFVSGGRIMALPSTGGRSFSGNVFLDEYAYQQHASEVWDAAAAVTLLAGKLRVVSTPNGVGNEFHGLHKIASKSGSAWKLHEIPMSLAIAEGYPVNIEDCWTTAKGDPRLFAQLFQCSFLDGVDQYVPTDKVLASVVEELDPRLAGRRFAGLDIGLTNDLTALIVVEQDERGVCHIVDVDECKRTDWEAQQALVEKSAAYWEWERICVDATGLGAVPAQLLQSKLGKMRVEPVTFTQQSKEAMATLLYQAFNDRMVRMLRDDLLVADICALRRTVTSTGAVRYDAPRTEEGHADRAWALALALQACDRKPVRGKAYGDGDFT
jgi:phage FluMu gp28-like protein